MTPDTPTLAVHVVQWGSDEDSPDATRVRHEAMNRLNVATLHAGRLALVADRVAAAARDATLSGGGFDAIVLAVAAALDQAESPAAGATPAGHFQWGAR